MGASGAATRTICDFGRAASGGEASGWKGRKGWLSPRPVLPQRPFTCRRRTDWSSRSRKQRSGSWGSPERRERGPAARPEVRDKIKRGAGAAGRVRPSPRYSSGPRWAHEPEGNGGHSSGYDGLPGPRPAGAAGQAAGGAPGSAPYSSRDQSHAGHEPPRSALPRRNPRWSGGPQGLRGRIGRIGDGAAHDVTIRLAPGAHE